MTDWHTAGRAWLQDMADKEFAAWRQSKQGKKWNNKTNPYLMGFRLPNWHSDAIKALGANDEETFKAIRLARY